MTSEVLIPIAFFGMIGAIVLVPQYLRSKERERLHATLRLAYEKGQPVPPELIEAIQSAPAPAPRVAPEVGDRDLRLGVIWLAIGVGTAAIGGAFYGMLYSVGGAVETFFTFVGLSALPLAVGLAYLLLFALGRRKRS